MKVVAVANVYGGQLGPAVKELSADLKEDTGAPWVTRHTLSQNIKKIYISF